MFVVGSISCLEHQVLIVHPHVYEHDVLDSAKHCQLEAFTLCIAQAPYTAKLYNKHYSVAVVQCGGYTAVCSYWLCSQ
jgi:hypothetical protein